VGVLTGYIHTDKVVGNLCAFFRAPSDKAAFEISKAIRRNINNKQINKNEEQNNWYRYTLVTAA
jgi:hypothetical protein